MPSAPRFQVFVSSTYTDLVSERQAVMSALLQFDALPAGMELFPAADDEAWTLIKRVIDESDYYLLMVGGRYGSVDADGISYTEKEYDYAVAQGKPVMAFMHGKPDDLPVKASDTDAAVKAKLDAFREKVKKAKHVKFWKSRETLQLGVTQSFAYFIKTYPAVGWVRGDSGDSPKTIARLAEAQDRIAALEAQLMFDATQPPAGAAGLASGEEELEYDCDIQIEILNLTFGSPVKKSQRMHGEYTISWDKLLSALGPLVMDEASQVDLRSRFLLEARKSASDSAREQVKEWLHDEIDPDFVEGTKEYGMPVEPRFVMTINPGQDAFETVLIQLQALGLITSGAKKRGVNDQRVYWTLTPWGRTRLMQLRSVRSGASRPPIEAIPDDGGKGE